MAGNEKSPKTIKERRLQIQAKIIPLLNMPSAYTVWNPVEMDWRISKSTRILTVGDIEVNYMAGKYAKSDMHILKAVHALGYATKAHISALLKYWRKVDGQDAQKNKRERLNIPNLTDKELWLRIMELCRYGVLIRNEFWPSDVIRKPGDTARSIFRVSANGTNMYKTILSDHSFSFDPRLAYMNEEDVFRYVLADMLATGFLKHPLIKNVRFNVSVHVGKRNYPILSEAVIPLTGEEGSPCCKLIYEGVTFCTNPEVVTRMNRYKIVQNRMKDLWTVLQFYKTEIPTYLLLCAEDGYGIKDLLKIIQDIDARMFDCCLFTTGAVLEANNVLAHPENLSDSFLEFVPEGGGKLVGAVGYYFLEWENGVVGIDI